MRWIAPSEKDTATGSLEKRLWTGADPFRAYSGLRAAQYSKPGPDIESNKAQMRKFCVA